MKSVTFYDCTACSPPITASNSVFQIATPGDVLSHTDGMVGFTPFKAVFGACITLIGAGVGLTMYGPYINF